MELVELSLPHLVRPPRIPIRRPPLLFLLHGLDSNEKEIYSIASSIDDRFLVVCPRAPFVHIAGRFNWFHVETISGGQLASVAQVEFSRQKLSNFIHEAAVAYKANPDQVYLMGFSQGASMALCVMASEPDKVAGAVVVNGQLLPETRALITKPSALRGFPVLVVHGLSDDFAPIAQGHAIHEMLTGWAANIIYREYPMGHLLTQESLIDTRSWLKSRLDEKGIIADSEAPAYQARLGHVHLKVRNLDRAVGFYIRVLGFHLVERVGNAYAFLSGGNAHHEIALQNVGLNAPVPPPQATGLYHVAFEVPDQESFARAYKALKKADIQVTTVDQVISWGMYFTDPDGNGIEIYCDARNLPGRSDLWRGRDSPLELSKILAVLENLD